MPRYGPRAISILREVWEAAGYPWSVRLKAILRRWLPWIRKRFGLALETQRQLLSISARQIDRRLGQSKRRFKRRLYGRTKPGSLLKHHIPIRTDNWDVTAPGFAEVDCVSHSGNSGEGRFVYSVNLADIHSAWVETEAILGKQKPNVPEALERVREALPFALRGIDSDNGSEFLNDELWGYCQAQKIQFTRGRPYKKDDNAHIEQKNWTHVRKLVGWDRYDSEAARGALNDLYRKEWRLMINLFQPSVKLSGKKRVGLPPDPPRRCRPNPAGSATVLRAERSRQAPAAPTAAPSPRPFPTRPRDRSQGQTHRQAGQPGQKPAARQGANPVSRASCRPERGVPPVGPARENGSCRLLHEKIPRRQGCGS
jgi:hypothetical protein